MKNDVYVATDSPAARSFAQVFVQEFDLPVAAAQIRERSALEVVGDPHRCTQANQTVNQMRTDEAHAPRDQYPRLRPRVCRRHY
jgi:hypothetical protein